MDFMRPKSPCPRIGVAEEAEKPKLSLGPLILEAPNSPSAVICKNAGLKYLLKRDLSGCNVHDLCPWPKISSRLIIT